MYNIIFPCGKKKKYVITSFYKKFYVSVNRMLLKNICSRYVKFIQPKVRQLLFYLLVQILKWNPAPLMTQTMDLAEGPNSKYNNKLSGEK